VGTDGVELLAEGVDVLGEVLAVAERPDQARFGQR
jgi:hypothetical protein